MALICSDTDWEGELTGGKTFVAQLWPHFRIAVSRSRRRSRDACGRPSEPPAVFMLRTFSNQRPPDAADLPRAGALHLDDGLRHALGKRLPVLGLEAPTLEGDVLPAEFLQSKRSPIPLEGKHGRLRRGFIKTPSKSGNISHEVTFVPAARTDLKMLFHERRILQMPD